MLSVGALCSAPIWLVSGIVFIVDAKRVKPNAFETFEEWLTERSRPFLEILNSEVPQAVLDLTVQTTSQEWPRFISAMESLKKTQGTRGVTIHTHRTRDSKDTLLVSHSGLEAGRFTWVLKSKDTDDRRPSRHIGTVTLWAARSPNGQWKLVLHDQQCMPWAFSLTALDLREDLSFETAFRAAPEFWHDLTYISQRQPVLLFTCGEIADKASRFDREIAPWLGPTLASRGIVVFVGDAGSKRSPTELGMALEERGFGSVGMLLLDAENVSWSVDIDWTQRSGKEVLSSLMEMLHTNVGVAQDATPEEESASNQE